MFKLINYEVRTNNTVNCLTRPELMPFRSTVMLTKYLIIYIVHVAHTNLRGSWYISPALFGSVGVMENTTNGTVSLMSILLSILVTYWSPIHNHPTYNITS